jgi:hypothetical protein
MIHIAPNLDPARAAMISRAGDRMNPTSLRKSQVPKTADLIDGLAVSLGGMNR